MSLPPRIINYAQINQRGESSRPSVDLIALGEEGPP